MLTCDDEREPNKACTYQGTRLFHKGDFLILKPLSSVVSVQDGFVEDLFLWMRNEAAGDFDPFLQLAISVCNESIALIY